MICKCPLIFEEECYGAEELPLRFPRARQFELGSWGSREIIIYLPLCSIAFPKGLQKYKLAPGPIRVRHLIRTCALQLR
jgi:hypothetical protein